MITLTLKTILNDVEEFTIQHVKVKSLSQLKNGRRDVFARIKYNDLIELIAAFFCHEVKKYEAEHDT
mgnify:CR=1 FL=1